jgi:putative transposase
MFRRTGLTALTLAADAPAFGRFEASRPNEIWTGDALHAIRVSGRKTYLFAFLDDHSRAVMAARFGFAEDTIRLAAALRPALASRGVPAHAYVDDGSAFGDAWLLRACAKLGIKLVHSQPGRPEGRGKIERFFRTVRDQFLVELTEERRRPDPGLGRAEQAVHRLDRDGLPRPGALRDRAAAAGPVGSRRPVPAPGRGGPG